MKILVADDDPVTLKLVCKALDDLGHTTTSARDGDEAWAAFESAQPDVIISDWQMPRCTGIELCQRVRQNADRYTYFIMLTSHNAHDQQLNGMQAGADDYLAKPFVKEELTLRLIAAERITTLHATLRSQQQELQRLNEQLYRDGRRCALTRVANRLQLDEDLAQRHATTHRYGQAFCLAMFDIDFFKAYNDTCGHVAGDQILKQVAATLAGAGRLSDRVYRYGGEEFTAVYGFGNLQGATAAAERMRGAVAALSLAHPGHPQGGVLTVSGGVVCYSGEPKTTVQELIARADAALYQAKERGRNQIVTG